MSTALGPIWRIRVLTGGVLRTLSGDTAKTGAQRHSCLDMINHVFEEDAGRPSYETSYIRSCSGLSIVVLVV